MKFTIALALSLLTIPANAQSVEPIGVYDTKLYCYAAPDAMMIVGLYEEKPLFTGLANLDSTDSAGEDTSLTGPMVFFVNQDTGTWVNYIFSPTGEICVISVGGNFEPYSD